MSVLAALRRRWPEALLIGAVTLPWLALLALGSLWLWQNGHMWAWAIGAAALALLAWPLTRLVRRRHNAEMRAALGDRGEPSRAWNTREREAWSAVLAIADATAPLSFIDVDLLLAKAREVVDAAAVRLHPEAQAPWAQFSLPDVLLLTERVSQNLRQGALRHDSGGQISCGSSRWSTATVQYGPWATTCGG